MYACMFKGWSGSELDTIVSCSPSYIEVDGKRYYGIIFVSDGRDSLDWFIEMSDDQCEEIILNMAKIHPSCIDLSEFTAIHIDGENDDDVDKDEWSWYTGNPPKEGMFDAAMRKLGLHQN